jgi:uncharacterized protein YcbK (DUF882 family)
MKLTPHFDTSEFQQPQRHGFEAAPYPEHWIHARLLPLCLVLEVLRADLGRPIRINSGYRSREYNAAIRGAKASQHIQGRAADIHVPGVSPDVVYGRLLALHRMGVRVAGGDVFTLGGLGSYPTFTHVDLRPGSLVRWTGSRSS